MAEFQGSGKRTTLHRAPLHLAPCTFAPLHLCPLPFAPWQGGGCGRWWVVLGGRWWWVWWWVVVVCRPILVFSLSLGQAEQYMI